MNRIIKFRAWDKKTKQFEEVVNLIFFRSNLIRLEIGCGGDAEEITIERSIEEVILQQFTGLKDKNGKEIYEGDIIRIESDLIGEIKWNETWNCLKLSHNESNGLFLNQEILGEIEILGNIFENPELLK